MLGVKGATKSPKFFFFFQISLKTVLWKSGICANIVQCWWFSHTLCNLIGNTISGSSKSFEHDLQKLGGKKSPKMFKTWLLLANIYLFKINYRNTRKRCKICSKLTIKTLERCHWRRFGSFIVNFEHILHLLLVFPLLTLNK